MRIFFFLLSSLALAHALDQASCDAIFQNPDGPAYFRIGNLSAYPEILQEDSAITLAQAGVYKGPSEFREYVSFASSLSPYVARGPILHGYNRAFLEYNLENDMCEYLTLLQTEYVLNDTLADSAEHFNVTYMYKYEMEYGNPHTKNVFVHYPVPFLNFFFTTLTSEKVAHYICDEMVNSCNNTRDGTPHETCVANFLELPVAQGELSHVDGNSRGCRALHAVLAGINPTLHCPHFAYTPTEDPKGNIKCQESKGYDPEDYFTPSDFAVFQEFQISLGVDPNVGYELSPYSPSSQKNESVGSISELDVDTGDSNAGNEIEEAKTDSNVETPAPSSSAHASSFSSSHAMGLLFLLLNS